MSKYYNLLNVTENATADEIKKAYRKLAMEYHPDRNPDDKKAEDKFKEITEAYSVLSNPEQRKKYDTMGDSQYQNMKQGFGGSGGSYEDIFRNSDFESIFRDLNFGDSFFGHGKSRNTSSRNQNKSNQKSRQYQEPQNQTSRYDLEHLITVGFMEAYNGSERQVSFSLSNGEMIEARIKIPAGIETNKKLRVKGYGLAKPNGTRGDLYLEVTVSSHPDFIRIGNDVETTIQVPFSLLCLGGSLSVPTPHGLKQVKMKPPLENGVKIRLKGLGFPHMENKELRGDLYAVLHVKIPKIQDLDEETKNLIEQLQEKGF